MFGAKRSVWWRKADFRGEKGCWGYNGGVLGCKWGFWRCLAVKGVFGGVKGCRRDNGVFET